MFLAPPSFHEDENLAVGRDSNRGTMDGTHMIPLPTIDALDAVTIPVACPVSWDAMHGNERTRFCDSCRQNVHDVSELTRGEALDLLKPAGKTPCLRIYRRQDGRVMTADCCSTVCS